VAPQPSVAAESRILICPILHAKQMPHDFQVEAMKFTGPAGDGRRGSAGFVVQTKDLLDGGGTQLSFTFQRDASGYGFQVIHPLTEGHVLVSVSSSVTIHRGGSWGEIGWGNPATSDKIKFAGGAAKVLPLKANTKHTVTSELSAQGKYRLWIDDALICAHTIEATKPLVLEVPKKAAVWGGSGWARTPFAGEGFKSKLEPGHAGLILGPMDGSGPKQNFQQIHLGTVR